MFPLLKDMEVFSQNLINLQKKENISEERSSNFVVDNF